MKVKVKNIDWCIEPEDIEQRVDSAVSGAYENMTEQEAAAAESEIREVLTMLGDEAIVDEVKKSLPKEVELDVESEDEIADTLSDTYGWLVNSYEIEK